MHLKSFLTPSDRGKNLSSGDRYTVPGRRDPVRHFAPPTAQPRVREEHTNMEYEERAVAPGAVETDPAAADDAMRTGLCRTRSVPTRTRREERCNSRPHPFCALIFALNVALLRCAGRCIGALVRRDEEASSAASAQLRGQCTADRRIYSSRGPDALFCARRS